MIVNVIFLEKVYNFLDSYSGTRFFYKPLQLLKVEVPKF